MPDASRLWFLSICLLLGLLPPAVSRTAEPPSRPLAWATKIDRPGLPNLHKVNDKLYRGAQPTAEGIKQLEKMGVRTIVNLRANHSDKEIIGNAKIRYESIPIDTWDVDDKQVVGFLRIVTDKDRQPVFVHCQHGADRTGTMCAAYRVVVDGWSEQQAIDEMTKGGFGFHSLWSNLPKFVKSLDMEGIRTKAGLKK